MPRKTSGFGRGERQASNCKNGKKLLNVSLWSLLLGLSCKIVEEFQKHWGRRGTFLLPLFLGWEILWSHKNCLLARQTFLTPPELIASTAITSTHLPRWVYVLLSLRLIRRIQHTTGISGKFLRSRDKSKTSVGCLHLLPQVIKKKSQTSKKTAEKLPGLCAPSPVRLHQSTMERSSCIQRLYSQNYYFLAT